MAKSPTYWQDAVRRLKAEGRPFDIDMERARELDEAGGLVPEGWSVLPTWRMGPPEANRNLTSEQLAELAKVRKERDRYRDIFSNNAKNTGFVKARKLGEEICKDMLAEYRHTRPGIIVTAIMDALRKKQMELPQVDTVVNWVRKWRKSILSKK